MVVRSHWFWEYALSSPSKSILHWRFLCQTLLLLDNRSLFPEPAPHIYTYLQNLTWLMLVWPFCRPSDTSLFIDTAFFFWCLGIFWLWQCPLYPLSSYGLIHVVITHLTASWLGADTWFGKENSVTVSESPFFSLISSCFPDIHFASSAFKKNEESWLLTEIYFYFLTWKQKSDFPKWVYQYWIKYYSFRALICGLSKVLYFRVRILSRFSSHLETTQGSKYDLL